MGSNSVESDSNDQSGDSAGLLSELKSLLSGPPSDLRTVLLREMLVGVIGLHAQPIELLDIKIINRPSEVRNCPEKLFLNKEW